MSDKALREQLLWLLGGGDAHLDFEAAVANLPVELRGRRPPGVPHTPWRLLQHMRIAQWDILEFCRNPEHVSPKFPDGYWQEDDGPPNVEAWDSCVEAFRRDLDAMRQLVSDPATNLFAPLSGSDGKTVLREALLVADHNAYHLGQLVAVRRALNTWPPDAG